MALDPWYRSVKPRKEVREGRSFSPNEFAIALEQVLAGTAPEDYSDPAQFFSRTYFTKALKEQIGMVLRRLSGRTENTAPVLTLITQFGGGKTHALASLYHLARAGENASRLSGIAELLTDERVTAVPSTRVGVFVGNAWDPRESRETPWIDLARQLAGAEGVEALGVAAKTSPPGTEALTKVFATADAPVLLLFDEVLNFINRHRDMAEHFYAFIQNLTVAVTSVNCAAAVISLPRSQVEMTDEDQKWQQRITKVVRRVAKDLIAIDESEISEVVRRRLFEDLGNERIRKKVAKAYADWCFRRAAFLPQEWLRVDTARTEAKAKEFLRGRFEACYPFHPATLSVFQRKWSALPQFQRTRGALALLAQWISWVFREHFQKARSEPLITLGSAPLHVAEFRAVVLGQLGEDRLDVAIDADVSGPMAHARPLDADAKGGLRDIHRRVGTAILFESSGGQVEKIASLPELRFALGEPEVDTTNIDAAAEAMEKSGFFIRKIGTDGFCIHHQATLTKAVNDRRASLDEEKDVKPATRQLVEREFKEGSNQKRNNLQIIFFPKDSGEVQDSSSLALVILDPETEWKRDDSQLRARLGNWTRKRGDSPRLHPGALIWCAKKPGGELRQKVEWWLAWKRVQRDMQEGILGAEYDREEHLDIQKRVRDAEQDAKEEVWASYRFVLLLDKTEQGLKDIDLGAGHSSASETLRRRVIEALKSEALLSESVGASYIERHWPAEFKDKETWPLTSLLQSFLDGSLTRLIDTRRTLTQKIVEFVEGGDFGLGSDERGDGGFNQLWYREPIHPEEVVFEEGVFLVKKDKAEDLKGLGPDSGPGPDPDTGPGPGPGPDPDTGPDPVPIPIGVSEPVTLHLKGTVPNEVWNRLGIKILPKLQSGDNLSIGIDISVDIDGRSAGELEDELKHILKDLGLDGPVRVERS